MCADEISPGPFRAGASHPVRAGVRHHLLVGRPEQFEQLELAGAGEQLVVPLDVQQRRRQDARVILVSTILSLATITLYLTFAG